MTLGADSTSGSPRTAGPTRITPWVAPAAIPGTRRGHPRLQHLRPPRLSDLLGDEGAPVTRAGGNAQRRAPVAANRPATPRQLIEAITSTRTSGDRRGCRRAVPRRLAVVRAAQHVGLSLDEVRTALAGVVVEAAPTRRQWARMSATWRTGLDARITELEQVRSNLASCVVCGCLSMRQCAPYNIQGVLVANHPGGRRLLAGSP